ncbi:MAG: response regulator [Candidatus Kapaibacterium sp.]
MNVCVVEDNISIRKLFSTLLKKSGFTVVDFETAWSAINWMRTNITDVVILDILLPDLSGLDAIGIIRQIKGYESIPVIAVTGFAADTDKDKYLAAGFDHYISKPVNVPTFAQEIKDLLKN